MWKYFNNILIQLKNVPEAKQKLLHWLISGTIIVAGAILIGISQPVKGDDIAGAALSGLREESQPIQVGDIENTDLQISYNEQSGSSITLQYPGASYIKLHFSKADLVPGDTISISDPAGFQSYTYPGAGYTTDSGDGFWVLSIIGDTVVIELHTGEGADISIPPGKADIYQRALDGTPKKDLGITIDQFARGFPIEEIQSSLYGTESTCGSNQRTDVVCYENSHPAEFQKANAVSRLLINSTSLCTGWRASGQNRIFTNEHCVSNQNDVSGTEVWFNYQRLACGSGGTGTTTVVSGDTFLTDSANYDFALFTVNNFESISNFGYLNIDPRTPILNEEIYIPQHGNGNPKEFGIESDMDSGNVCRINDAIVNGRIANSDTGYFCDTIGGSSGSPVLSRSNHEVIAIHHFGTGGAACSSSTMNQGVRMDLIWPLVEQFFETTTDIGPLVYNSHTIDDDSIGNSTGNSNGVAECGESIELFVDLLNQGSDGATGISAAISTNDNYVTWTGNTSSSYADIPGGETAANSDDFDLMLAQDTPDGHTITFTMDITAGNGGPWSDSFDITVSCSPPDAPTNLTAGAAVGSGINMTWVDNASSETAYHIERSPNGSTNWTEIDTVGANMNSYLDNGLECDTDYYYRVRAFRSGDGQYSGYSNTANGKSYACTSQNLAAGWNLITLPLQPVDAYQAQSLLDDINDQGGDCSEINRWLNGSWESHIDGETFNNFEISMGDGYFVKCSQPVEWIMEGTNLESGVSLNMVNGWNLIGVPYPVSGYFAQSILDDINNQGGVCSEVDRWMSGGWDAHLEGTVFNNFSIGNQDAYFVKCSQASSFTPADN